MPSDQTQPDPTWPDLTRPDQENYQNSFLQQNLLCKTYSASWADSTWKTTSIFDSNGRRPQFVPQIKDDLNFCYMEGELIFVKWKMTLIFWQMEDNLNFFLQMEDNLNIFENVRQPHFFQMEDDLNPLKNKRRLQYFGK